MQIKHSASHKIYEETKGHLENRVTPAGKALTVFEQNFIYGQPWRIAPLFISSVLNAISHLYFHDFILFSTGNL